MSEKIYIPNNQYGIEEGYYEFMELFDIMGKKKHQPRTISFIKAMLEE